jgi:DNA-binding response OmpR family regulator
MPNRKLLIVEDHESSAEGLAHALELRGFSCDIARSFAEGVACAQKIEYACIISDLQLPDSDRVETAQRINEYGRPVIALTAFQDEKLIEILHAIGAGWELKPVKLERLLPKILSRIERNYPDPEIEREMIEHQLAMPGSPLPPHPPPLSGETRVSMSVMQMFLLISTIVGAAWWVSGKTNDIGMSLLTAQNQAAQNNIALTKQITDLAQLVRDNTTADAARDKATADRVADWTPWRQAVTIDLRNLGTVTKTTINAK